MSFGWSAGDLVSTVKLITSIITSLHHTRGSASYFQELELELQGLQRPLIEIDGLTGDNDQIPEICALKFASCGCKETLERFWEKLKPFEESLGASKAKGSGDWKAAPRW